MTHAVVATLHRRRRATTGPSPYPVYTLSVGVWAGTRSTCGYLCCADMGMHMGRYAINVWVFVLLFVLIDKRDEFQLVNFILKFKGASKPQ